MRRIFVIIALILAPIVATATNLKELNDEKAKAYENHLINKWLNYDNLPEEERRQILDSFAALEILRSYEDLKTLHSNNVHDLLIRKMVLDPKEVAKIDPKELDAIDSFALAAPIQRGLFRLDPHNARILPIVEKTIAALHQKRAADRHSMAVIIYKPLSINSAKLLVPICKSKSELSNDACESLRYLENPHKDVMDIFSEKNDIHYLEKYANQNPYAAEKLNEVFKELRSNSCKNGCDARAVKDREIAKKNGAYFLAIVNRYESYSSAPDRLEEERAFMFFLNGSKKMTQENGITLDLQNPYISLDGDLSAIDKMTVETRYKYGVFNQASEDDVPSIYKDNSYVTKWVENPKLSEFEYKLDLEKVPEPKKMSLRKGLKQLPSWQEHRIRIYTKDGQVIEKILKYEIAHSC